MCVLVLWAISCSSRRIWPTGRAVCKSGFCGSGYENSSEIFSLSQKNVPRLCSTIVTESRKNSFRCFQSFVWNPTIRFIRTFQRRSHCHCTTVVYFTLLPVSDHLLPHLNVSSLSFQLLNNNHSTKDQHEFPPLSFFPIQGAFGVRSESVGSSYPDPTKIRTRGRVPYSDPQKPDRAACWSIRQSLAKQEHNTR